MTVSVITPNFNNAPYVKSYLASIVDDPAVSEIIVYDNASADGSAELLDELAGPKLRLIRGKENLGATGGRHRAAEAASSEYLCILDGDDFLSPLAVSTAMDRARRDDLDMAIFQLYNVAPDGGAEQLSISVPERIITGQEACAMTLGGWHIHPLGLIRRSVYFAAWKGFRQYGYSDDELLTRHIFLAADRVAGVPDRYYYRQVPKPATMNRERGTLKTALAVMRLGREAGLPEPALRRQRNMVARFLLGMARRRLDGRISGEEFAVYLREFSDSPVPWRVSDWKSALIVAALRMLPR